MSVPEECQARVSSKSVLQECHVRVSSKKGVLQECHLSVSRQGVPQVGSLENVINKYCFCSSTYVSAFGFVGFILFSFPRRSRCSFPDSLGNQLKMLWDALTPVNAPRSAWMPCERPSNHGKSKLKRHGRMAECFFVHNLSQQGQFWMILDYDGATTRKMCTGFVEAKGTRVECVNSGCGGSALTTVMLQHPIFIFQFIDIDSIKQY